MRLPRRRLRILLALAATVGLLPFLLVTAVYFHTLRGLGDLPQPPPERPIPGLLAVGIWEDIGERSERFEVEKTWPWTPVLDLALHRFPEPPGSKAASRVASLWLASRPRTPMAPRHLRRVVLTVWLSRNWSASELTQELALQSYFGRKATGVHQAALAYFGKSPESLTAGQAALLVGLLRSPTQDGPDRNPKRAESHRNRVLKRWSAAGRITAEEQVVETSKPLGVLPLAD